MKLTKENAKRKIDTLGRVSIPKSMRDRLGLKELSEVEFFMLDDNGKRYVCLTAVSEAEDEDNKEKYATAVEVLRELGYAAPKELKERAGL